MAGDSPEVSVIVPTRDRPAGLARCLHALEQQTVAARLEIVVVDDGSELRRTIADIARDAPRARLRRLEGHGPAAARNAGVAAARGRVVCFVDDDCEPARDWAEALTAPLREIADVVAGVTVNPRPEDAYAAASQAIADFLVRPATSGSRSVTFAPSCNLACSRELAVSLPFDEGYSYPGGEDRDWCARVRAAGFRILQEPAAVVFHRQELSLPGFWRQQFHYGQGAFRFRQGHPGARRLDTPPYGRLLRDGFGEGVGTGLLVCLAQIATAAGYASAAARSRS